MNWILAAVIIYVGLPHSSAAEVEGPQFEGAIAELKAHAGETQRTDIFNHWAVKYMKSAAALNGPTTPGLWDAFRAKHFIHVKESAVLPNMSYFWYELQPRTALKGMKGENPTTTVSAAVTLFVKRGTGQTYIHDKWVPRPFATIALKIQLRDIGSEEWGKLLGMHKPLRELLRDATVEKLTEAGQRIERLDIEITPDGGAKSFRVDVWINDDQHPTMESYSGKIQRTAKGRPRWVTGLKP